jgi:hypothetical protein
MGCRRSDGPDACPFPLRPRSASLLLFAVLVGIELAWLAADRTPMLFLGDSASYLATATIGYIPPDRTFLYGYLIRVLAVWTKSLVPLLLAQALAAALAAFLLAQLLRQAFHASVPVAVGIAIAWAALEPLGRMYERYLLAEALTLPLLAAFVLNGCRYLDTGSLRPLAAVHLLGTAVLALRYAFVPIAWVAAVALPVVALWTAPRAADAGRGPALRRLLRDLAFSVLLVAALHQGFKAIHGNLAHRPPAYQYTEGLFLAAAWAPLLTPADFADAALGARVLLGLPCALPDRSQREGQRWSADCLAVRLTREAGSELAANAIAKSAALRAMRRDPAGVARLAWASWTDWFDRTTLADAMRYDRGVQPIPPDTAEALRKNFGAGAHGVPEQRTATGDWFLASAPWLMLLAASPAIAWIAIPLARREDRGKALWLWLLIAAIVGLSIVVGTKVVPRYLHPVGWLFAAAAGAAVSRWLGRGERRTRDA